MSGCLCPTRYFLSLRGNVAFLFLLVVIVDRYRLYANLDSIEIPGDIPVFYEAANGRFYTPNMEMMLLKEIEVRLCSLVSLEVSCLIFDLHYIKLHQESIKG